jgi:hypothetical protein
MILKHELSQDSVLGFEITDRVTDGEYQRMIHEIYASIEQHGCVRLLVLIPDVTGTEQKTIDERLRFLKEHSESIERYAIVGDERMAEWVADVAGSRVGIDVCHFSMDDEEHAWTWLRE